jgi:hypothetical protein
MIQKLLVGFFLLSAPSLALANTAVFDSSFQQSYIERGVVYLRARLGLTAAQTATVRAAMESVVHHTATKTVAQVLREICTPAQFAIWTETIKLASQQTASSMARSETDEVEKTTPLSPDQRKKVEAAFYQIELADRAYDYTGRQAELEANLSHVAVERENALEKILTASQIAQRTRIATAGITKPLPDLPTLSLAANPAPNRYGWTSDSAAP